MPRTHLTLNTPADRLNRDVSDDPRLRALQPGTDQYTVALRSILIELRRDELKTLQTWQASARRARQLQQWQTLHDRHIQRIAPLARHRHLMVLTPRVVISGLQASSYPFGLLCMTALSYLLLRDGFGPSGVVLGVLGGTLLMALYNYSGEIHRRRVLRSFGLTEQSRVTGIEY